MIALYDADITVENGLIGDYKGTTKRQITVLSEEAWTETCADLKTNLPWLCRRANLLVSGLELENTIGNYLSIGDVLLEIIGETTPCVKMNDAHGDLLNALIPNWRGGVSCRVVQGGKIKMGDSAILKESL